MDDFSFFWELANMKQMTIQSAIQICQLMQTPFMVTRESKYRGVADKIFFKLISRFANDSQMKNFLKKHTEQTLKQLDEVD